MLKEPIWSDQWQCYITLYEYDKKEFYLKTKEKPTEENIKQFKNHLNKNIWKQN